MLRYRIDGLGCLILNVCRFCLLNILNDLNSTRDLLADGPM
jgi:hypothetical protein